MKKIAILQSNYIPWKGYFDIIQEVDTFIIYDDVNYSKNDWRNRNKIKTGQGVQWLTIPVTHKSLNQKINETKIAREGWNIKHWKSISSAYSKAPYFKIFEDYFKQIYLNFNNDYLSEINLILIKAIMNLLEIETKIIESQSLQLKGDRNERLINAISKLNGTHYLSGPSAKTYLDLDLFKKNNIDIEWMDYSNYSEYPQLYPPFVHEVSILDLIFNTGVHNFQSNRRRDLKLAL